MAVDRRIGTVLGGYRIEESLGRAGLRPGGLAPTHTLTRFSWSLRDPPG